MKEETQKFETGAIRSNDAYDLNYSLISPLGLIEVAKIAHKPIYIKSNSKQCINEAIQFKYSALSGDSIVLSFSISAFLIIAAIEQENKEGVDDTPIDYDDRPSNDLRFDLIPYEGLKRIAQRYHMGKEKYGMYNWEKGMDILSLQDHSIEHLRKYQSGNRDDDHLAAAAWGDLASIHSYFKWPELNYIRHEGCNLNSKIEDYLEKLHATKSFNKSN